jgi:DNA adenine methylase
LNRACWNGLYRENRRGEFNVPKGTKDAIILPTDDFFRVAKALQETELVCSDFEDTLDRTTAGDFVFVDPPYTVNHNTNGFIKYNQAIFSWEDQRRLRAAVERAAKRGALLLVTNADHVTIARLYRGLGCKFTLARKSILAAKSRYRVATTEAAICINYTPQDEFGRTLVALDTRGQIRERIFCAA